MTNLKKTVLVSTKNAIQNSFPYLAAVLTPFLATHPEWELVFYSAIGLYGVYMACNQEEVNEIVEFISKHPDQFRKELIESKEFKKGFLIFTEQYLKQRLERKKKLLKCIFLGYTLSTDRSKFELERLNDTLLSISLDSLEFLTFFKKTIYPAIDEQINTELLQDTYQKSDRSVEWWHDFMVEIKPIWEPIDKWIYDNYNQNSHKVKTQYNMLSSGWPSELLHRVDNLERAKRSEFIECISEMVSLGILRLRVTGGTIGSGSGSDYNFTAFGRKFLKLVEE